ncbi:beta-N-acetylhexosaminidase [Cognatazoarcus halotolerans]|uniref:beta-N-acetylhexosaminidase n=1 Tax=Cognatazoarcus halotolerans TaxID=2686016 RepID=UPI001F1BD102|nr:beta-N-acetylhexosaminidase [Cognatazoarcus halotolerans]
MNVNPAERLPGPVMLDVAGLRMTSEEKEILRHPLVGGVILFSRNFESPEQLAALTAEIHAQRSPELVIAVDQEGGRVQRFRNGFTRLPAMRRFGELWQEHPGRAVQAARETGFLLAAELRACGVDLSFTPVLDLDYGVSKVIGDRAFHRDPRIAAPLAEALAEGLAEAGMGCVGKHFPGHGYVCADSHVEVPTDERDFESIWTEDLQPYRARIGERLSGVMPAHVTYRAVDPSPAGFSRFWLQDVLRGRLGFKGVIFSDDLTMEGATVAGDIVARASAAHEAGCDMVLVCNRPDLAVQLLDGWHPTVDPMSRRRITQLREPAHHAAPIDLKTDMRYLAACETVGQLLPPSA